MMKIFKIITSIIIIFLILSRFNIREYKNIFFDISLHQGLIYFFIFYLNLILLLLLTYGLIQKKMEINTKNSDLLLLLTDIKEWIKDSHFQLIKYIMNFPILGKILTYLVAYFTRLLIKIGKRKIFLIYYISRYIFLILFFYDIFIINKFHFSYKFIFILIIPLTITFFLKISLWYNEDILNQIEDSLIVINPQKMDKGEELLVSDFAFTEYNKEFKTINEALNIKDYVLEENDILYDIESQIEDDIVNKYLIRLFYVLGWGYILYFYPIPIIFPILFIIHNKILIYFPTLYPLLIITLLILIITKI